MKKNTIQKGFSLVELLVVVTIMILIVSVATVSYQKTIQLTRDGKRKTDLEQLRQALEIYRSETGRYPNTSGDIGVALSVLSPNYMRELPKDPRNYNYSYWGDGSNYVVCASTESTSEGASGSCSGLSCGIGVPCNYFVTRP